MESVLMLGSTPTITFDTTLALALVAAALAAGIGVLAASLGVGGTFRLIKKGYAWVFGKMG